MRLKIYVNRLILSVKLIAEKNVSICQSKIYNSGVYLFFTLKGQAVKFQYTLCISLVGCLPLLVHN